MAISLVGCTNGAGQQGENDAPNQRPIIERLAGDIDLVPPAHVLDKGKALMSYSDCATCHKAADRKRGPAFHDIAARYPMNSTYIDILAKRIVLGTKGAWGNVVMPPHPTVTEDDAKTMVKYILSLGPQE
ncbi:c-type cytochrome [Parapedobacter sp. 2B3]|uniref:c-type cytochrome n=1 Tax=Parapedobacter sp. 2B3 TaxID=3342381 RepID=UPI0035B69C43